MIKNIIIFFLFLPLIIGMYYLNALAGVLEFILGIIMYSFIFYFFHIIWRKFRKKEKLLFEQFLQKFLLSISSLGLTVVFLLGFFGYYQTILHPLTLQQHTVSNGEKTLVFQEMIHIGSEQYYQKIVDEITQYKNKNYVYYFEGVRLGSEENSEKFNQALGIKFDENLYKNLAITYGLVNQDNHIFLNIVNDNDINVDQNIDEIIEKYETLKLEKNIVDLESSEPINLNNDIITMLAQLEGRELELLQFINKSMLTLLTKNDAFISAIQDNFGNKELLEIILEGRNKTVADTIINSEDTLIYATYGALHYKGVLKLLQENDSNWKVIESKNFYPFQ